MSIENRHLARDLVALGRHVERAANAVGRQTANVGFTDALVLGALELQFGGRARPSDLTFHLLTTRPSVTAALRRLEDAGFIERQLTDEDRRAVWVVLTPAGYTAAESLTAAYDSFSDDLLGRLNKDQRQNLRHIIGQLGLEG